MANSDYKAFIVEGEAREPLIIANISKVFFNHGNFEIITLPAGENIYMLWKKLKDDDFDTDIIEVLRESNKGIREQLANLTRDDFSEIYLFFDYDAHQTNLGKSDDENVVNQMLESFNNETENGKLYISYPMVEALRDFEAGVCGKGQECYVPIEKLSDYKHISSMCSFNPHFKNYDIEIWKDIIDVFAMRVSCLMGIEKTIEYKDYSEQITPYEIQKIEEKIFKMKQVFVLSAFPEFLVDYFGLKLWKTCVKHTTNKLYNQKCQNNFRNNYSGNFNFKQLKNG